MTPEYDETTPNEEVLESPAEEMSEGTVPESRYHESVKAMNKAQQEAADLRKRLAELENTAPIPETESTPMTESEGESESMAMLREDFPELANALDELKSSFDKRLSEIEKSHSQLLGNIQKKYWNDINRAVPNLKDFVETPEFDDWWAKQTPEIQAQLVSPDPTEVADALKLYTADTGEVLKPDTETEQQAPNVTAIELNVEKLKPDKMEMAKKMAAPNIKPSSGGKVDEPFKMLSPEERAALPPEQLSVYAAKMRDYMSKGRK